MRADTAGITGSVGQDQVQIKFKQLNWGVAPNPLDQDLGTDLWLMARDPRRFDLGALLGAQIKSGGSWFASPNYADNGQLLGWWFAESDNKHFKYWTEHRVPHILVLHDPRSEVSYWVHLKPEAVKSTGKGSKILVPADAVVDEAHVDQLLQVATGDLEHPRWEGSTWGGGRTILREDRLRHALVTPRLVAPHPNLTVAAVESAEAIALLVKMRLRDLDPEHRPAPLVSAVDVCRESDDWGWRFYAALHGALLEDSDCSAVIELIPQADSAFESAAAAAAAAALLIEANNPEHALAVVTEVIDQDNCHPVDHAWLRAHRARCLVALGRLVEAREEAFEVQLLRYSAMRDPTAAAIVGATAELIFTTGERDSQSFADAITGRDTLAAWWRTQEVAWGLQDQIDEHFKKWGNDSTVTLGKFDTAYMSLRAATLIAGMTGDHAAWRQTLPQLAIRLITTAEGDDEVIARGLYAMRIAGDDKSLKIAIPHLLAAGPAAAVVRAVFDLDLARSTRTSLGADIELIRRAADVLPATDADRHLSWAIEVLEDPASLSKRLDPSFYIVSTVLEMVAPLVPALSGVGLRLLIDHLVDLPGQADQSAAHGYARVMMRIPQSAWTSKDLDALRDRAQDNFELSDQVMAVLVESEPGLRDSLQEKIAAGNLRALSAFGDVRELNERAVLGLVASLRERIEGQIRDLSRGVSTGWVHSFAGTLVLINVWHPAQSDWSPVIALLSARSNFVDHLREPLRKLMRLGEYVPLEVADQLDPALRSLMTSTVRIHPLLGGKYDPKGDAGAALAAIGAHRISEVELWDLLAGNKDQRAAAAVAIERRNCPDLITSLAALSKDPEPWVRAVVANCLARWVSKGTAADSAMVLLRRILDDPGTLVGRMVAVLLEGKPPNDGAAQLAAMLREHVSVEVRSAAARFG